LESQRYAQVGVSAIKWELTKLGVNFPSDRTITRIIKQEGLVKKLYMCPKVLSIRTFERRYVATTYTRWILSDPGISRATAGFIP